ncbi:hypothetical protein FRC04_002509 [Tulasnella sp. 424]|nr:hypothetical protein FRC04_002509 [Tulasnella sp. 424]KAG8967089.1 hypothetical protein FRC05_002303 [Tulasnella sp. 425]
MTAPPPKKLTALPKIPPAFGEDDGVFYKYYDDLADELDEDMVTSLKSQLDGILIFAGLFAGVNSAFLAFTLPQMSPDPTDDTNALLFQILLGGNSTIKSPADLPSASFSPPTSTYSINVLFSMSLTLALLGSFLAVLGQQWLVYYRKRSGGGAEYQRWEQLRRYLGAKRWRLELVLDDVLPSLLQVALVIFCVAFILYLGTLSRSLCYTIAAPLCAAGAIIVMTAMCAAWDHWCPFKSPLSHIIQPILKHLADIVGRIAGILWAYGVTTFEWLKYRLGFTDWETPFATWISYRAESATEWIKSRGQRPADGTDQLKVIALRRVLCTSEDSNAIVHAATNTQSISQSKLLGQILNDDELRGRLDALYTISYDSVGYTGNAAAHLMIQGTAISRALLHMILMAGSAEDLLPYNDRPLLRDGANDPEYSRELMKKLNEGYATFLLLGRFDVYNECAECSHCVALGYCMRLFWMILQPVRPTLIQIEPRLLEQHIRVTGASKEVGLAWIEAWLVKMLKEWDQLSGGEERLTPNSEVRHWQLQKMREFLHLYQNIDVPKFLQTILEAIQTSTDQWSDQPATEVYVGLFEHDLRVRENVMCYKYCLAVTINSLVTLLRSIEHRIRDPTTSSDERESQRKHRKTCTEKWITYINNAYKFGDSSLDDDYYQWRCGPLWWVISTEDSDFKPDVDETPQRFNRYHCIEASSTLLPYLQWMKDIIQPDPENADNPPMIKMATFLFGCLKDPEESIRQNERVLSGYHEFADNIGEGKIEEYREFYPVFAKTVRELESTVAAAVPHSSEVEKLETPPEYENLWSQGESCDIYLEWY